MKLLDFLKRKKEKTQKREEKRVKKEEKKTEKEPEIKKPKKKFSATAYRVLVSPHITEKATGLAEKNKYSFKVFPKKNKIEIKKAIEELYGVDVISVNIINMPGKKRRLGRQTGWRKGYKKAIVKIKEGQKIEVLPR